MENLNHNIKLATGMKRDHILSIHAAVIMRENDIEKEELEYFLTYLQTISLGITKQLHNYRYHKDYFKNAIEGLEKDLDANNKEIDTVQSMLQKLNSLIEIN